jgi:hypothetical protein
MGTEFIINGASGFNPGVDSALQLTDTDNRVVKIKATEDVGLEFLLNGTRTAPVQRVVAKTADYTVKLADHGTLFTNEGASGAVIFTLPATATLPTGWMAEFYVAADQNVTVTAGTADTMVADNELDADSVAASTATELIGNYIKVIKLTGTLVATILSRGAEDGTITIAD